jgi:wyosine [tRNA(Phe)-imidazoG37] synthetase (radical SAM superfamily)
MQKIIEIIDSCNKFADLKLFYDTFLMKAANDEDVIKVARGAFLLKMHQIEAKGKAQWKPERFPCTDEQPLAVIDEDEITKTAPLDGPY